MTADDYLPIRSGQSTVSLSPGITATFATRLPNFGTVRLRAGYGFGPFFPYLTGGLSYATATTSFRIATNAFSLAEESTASRSGIFPHVGVVGMGLDYGITDRLSLKAEYLYDFIDARYAVFAPAEGTSIGFGTREMYHVGRIGLSYRIQ